MDEGLKKKLKEKQIELIPKEDLKPGVDIGSGAFGSVCTAFHKGWQKDVAVKFMNIIDRLSEKDEKKLLNEAETMLRIRHEHLLYIYGVCIDSAATKPLYGIVMHYMENGSVKSFFQHLAGKAVVPWPIKVRLLYEVIDGVIFLHSKNVLHLDLKAANVLLSEDLHAKICDFGLSKWMKLSMSSSHSHSPVGGTLTHFPPECLEDVNTRPSPQSDIYSYSIYMWEVLTGKQVYENVQNAPQLMLAVTSGQRPDLSLLPSDAPLSCTQCVVPLMEQCWSAEPAARASVTYIIQSLRPLYEENKSAAQCAVPKLVKCLIDAKREEESLPNVAADFTLEDYVSEKMGNLPMEAAHRAEPPGGRPEQKTRDSNTTETKSIKRPCARVTIDNQKSKSMTWSGKQNGVHNSECYRVTFGDSSNSPRKKASVENNYKTQRGGTTTVNQINISGGSKVHIGNVYNQQQQHPSVKNREDEFEVNETPKPEDNGIVVKEPKAVVSDSHLQRIAFKIGKWWKVMGRSLLLDEAELDVLEKDYFSSGLVEIITQMLRKWKEKYGRKATRNWIATSLIHIRKDNVVDILHDSIEAT